MGRPFKVYLSGPRIYSCSTCRAHAADHDDIISKVGLTRPHGLSRCWLPHMPTAHACYSDRCAPLS